MRSNPNRLVSPRRTAVVGHDQHGWTAQSDEVMEMLGLKAGGHLPTEGMPERRIQSVTVWVTPAKDKGLTAQGRKAKSSTHRVMARCPCGWEGSAGRLHQHKCREIDWNKAGPNPDML